MTYTNDMITMCFYCRRSHCRRCCSDVVDTYNIGGPPAKVELCVTTATQVDNYDSTQTVSSGYSKRGDFES